MAWVPAETVTPLSLYTTPVVPGMVTRSVPESYVGVPGTTEVSAPAKIALTASGVGSDGSEPTVPYRNASSSARSAGATFVESTHRYEVGTRPAIGTGVVQNCHEKLMADGESFT